MHYPSARAWCIEYQSYSSEGGSLGLFTSTRSFPVLMPLYSATRPSSATCSPHLRIYCQSQSQSQYWTQRQLQRRIQHPNRHFGCLADLTNCQQSLPCSYPCHPRSKLLTAGFAEQSSATQMTLLTIFLACQHQSLQDKINSHWKANERC